MSFCIELPVTIIFWGFLFRILLSSPNITAAEIALNANLHAGPLITLIIDFIFNVYSFPTQHYFIVLLVGFLYALINLIYSLTVAVIYKPIDWVSLLSYGLIVGALAMSFLMHWLGRFVYNKLKKNGLNVVVISLLNKA
jgi:hypothetical protein